MGLGEDTQILKYKRLHFQKCSPAPIPENEHQTHWMLSAVKNLTTSLKSLTGSWTVFVTWSHWGDAAYQILWKELDLIIAVPKLITHSWKSSLCNVNHLDNKFTCCKNKQANKTPEDTRRFFSRLLLSLVGDFKIGSWVNPQLLRNPEHNFTGLGASITSRASVSPCAQGHRDRPDDCYNRRGSAGCCTVFQRMAQPSLPFCHPWSCHAQLLPHGRIPVCTIHTYA